MTTGTFKVNKAINTIVDFKQTKGTRLAINFTLVLMILLVIGFFVMQLVFTAFPSFSYANHVLIMNGHIVSRNIDNQAALSFLNQLSAHHSMSITHRIYFFLYQLMQIMLLVTISIGSLMIAIKKQRGEPVKFSDLFAYFTQIDKFFPIIIIYVLFLLALPSNYNLLGITPKLLHFNPLNHPLLFLAAIYTLMLIMLCLLILIGPAGLLIVDKKMGPIAAIKRSICLMCKQYNFFKALLVIVILIAFALCAELVIAMCVGVAGGIFYAVTNPIATDIAFFGSISLIALLLFIFTLFIYPGYIHMGAYIYRSIIGDDEKQRDDELTSTGGNDNNRLI
jgi:hypothetical protein